MRLAPLSFVSSMDSEASFGAVVFSLMAGLITLVVNRIQVHAAY